MSEKSASLERRTLPPFVARFAWWLIRLMPISYSRVRSMLVRDNLTEHTQHEWSRLRDVAELGRYSVIRGYCDFFKPGGAILDVGCGEGILQERLNYGRYTGIDLVEQPIRRAAAGKGDERTRFFQADAAKYVPDDQFDVIVWNETLYYMETPIATAERYCRSLRPDGIVIVSMLETWATRRLFRRLGTLGRIEAEVRLMTEAGVAWVVRAYRPRARELPNADE